MRPVLGQIQWNTQVRGALEKSIEAPTTFNTIEKLSTNPFRREDTKFLHTNTLPRLGTIIFQTIF